MKTEIVSITHTNEGIRVNWPDSTSSVFSNPVYLAEAYVVAMRNKEATRKLIVEDAAKLLNNLEALVENDGDAEAVMAEIRSLRDALTWAAIHAA